MSHSALSYDAEQTTVQALFFGERGSRHMRRPWRNGGSAHPCALPRVWGRFHGVCYSNYVKDVALV
ncbi:hypothetical protein REC12_05335 [Desulfosporosinus sp. PR]|nr:hypothetical protein [Desulfosporosinus sp. PR]